MLEFSGLHIRISEPSSIQCCFPNFLNVEGISPFVRLVTDTC